MGWSRTTLGIGVAGLAAGNARMINGLELPDRFRRRLGDVTGRGVVIGIVDSGFSHWGLVPRTSILPELAPTPDTTAKAARVAVDDRLGHGTACLTTAYRVAPGATFRSIRLFLEELHATPDALCWAIEAAESTGCRIVNLSLRVELGDWAERVYTACAHAREAGLILVAASHGERLVSLPAWFDNVLSVASGPQLDPFEFFALPEGPIDIRASCGIAGRITTADGEFTAKSIPSYSAPLISGIVALILERYPEARLEEVREILRELATTV